MTSARRPPRARPTGPAYFHSTSTLANGLDVVMVQMPHLHAAQVALLARAGSRYEAPEDNGLSHVLEHMFFRGAESFGDSHALNAAMEDLGGHLDGYTTRDCSGYPVTVHPNHVEAATEILGRMFVAPRFDDLKTERKIILEEMLDALDDRGREIEVDTLAHRAQFGAHGLGQPIEGPRKNVRRFTVDDLERHRRRCYGAKNLVLCFAGAIEPARCLRAAEKAFGELFSGRKVGNGGRPGPVEPSVKHRKTEDPQTRIRLTFRAVSDGHADHAALSLMRRALDGGLSARLPLEMVERRGIAYEVGADLTTYADTGCFDFELAVAHRKLPAALETLGDVIHELHQDGLGDEELKRLQHRVGLGVEMGLDSVSDMVGWFGVDHLFGRASSPEERLAKLYEVRAKDIGRVARKYLRADRLTVVTVGGASAKERSAGGAALEALSARLS